MSDCGRIIREAIDNRNLPGLRDMTYVNSDFHAYSNGETAVLQAARLGYWEIVVYLFKYRDALPYETNAIGNNVVHLWVMDMVLNPAREYLTE